MPCRLVRSLLLAPVLVLGLAAAAALAVGCASRQPSARSQPLIEAVSVGLTRDGIGLTTGEVTCVVRRAEDLGGPVAIREIEHHHDLRGLSGAPGRRIAQAFEACVGASFADAFGYQP